jgi:hypothetical protein
MDKIPEQFWAKWYKYYQARDTLEMENLIGSTLLGRRDIQSRSMMQDLLMDLMEYLETKKKVKK